MLCWLNFGLGVNISACEKGKAIDYGGAQVDVRIETDVCVGDVHRAITVISLSLSLLMAWGSWAGRMDAKL